MLFRSSPDGTLTGRRAATLDQSAPPSGGHDFDRESLWGFTGKTRRFRPLPSPPSLLSSSMSPRLWGKDQLWPRPVPRGSKARWFEDPSTLPTRHLPRSQPESWWLLGKKKKNHKNLRGQVLLQPGMTCFRDNSCTGWGLGGGLGGGTVKQRECGFVDLREGPELKRPSAQWTQGDTL